MRGAGDTPTIKLEQVRRQLDRWRRSRYWNVGRVPHALWRAAADVARAHGVEATGARLKLGVARLRLWGERSQPSGPFTTSSTTRTMAPQTVSSISFVELPPLTTGPAAEVTLELHQLHVLLVGGDADLATTNW